EFLEKALFSPPDLVFNIAEGLGCSRSREARVPAVLEMLGIPYTGSDPLTMAVTLDKECAKRLVSAAGATGPRSWSVPPNDASRNASRNNMSDHSRIRLPVVVKPAWEGSSKGIRNRCLVKNWDELPEVVESLRRDHQQTILIEEFIPGDELTVGIH